MNEKLKQELIAHAVADIQGLLEERMDDIYESMMNMKFDSDPVKKFSYAIGAKITLSPSNYCVKQHTSVFYGQRKKVETADIVIDTSQTTMEIPD